MLNGLLPPFHHLVFVGIAVVDIISLPQPLFFGKGTAMGAVFKLKNYFSSQSSFSFSPFCFPLGRIGWGNLPNHY